MKDNKSNNKLTYSQLMAKNEQQRKRIFTLTAKIKGLTLLSINTLHTEDKLIDTQATLKEHKNIVKAFLTMFNNKPYTPMFMREPFPTEIVKWDSKNKERPSLPLPKYPKIGMEPKLSFFEKLSKRFF